MQIKDHIRYCRLKFNNKNIEQRKSIKIISTTNIKNDRSKIRKNNSIINPNISNLYNIYLNPKNGNNINFTDQNIFKL